MSIGALQGEMTRVAGALYAFGGGLLALSVLVPTWSGADRGLLFLYAGIAVVTAAGLEVSARRRPLTVPQLMVVALLALVIVTLVVLAGGAEAAGTLAVFHVFILAYGFYYFPRWWAITEAVLVGVSYGLALAWLDVAGAASQWVLVTGTYTTVGAVFGSIGRSVRESLASEVESGARLRELDELKTTFLRAVSHELRTPLTNVVGYATTLQAHRHRLSDERTDELLERAVSNARRLEQMLIDLLDLDRVARGIVTPNLAATDVGLLARNVVEHLDFGQHPISVKTGTAVVQADASKIERIIENLLANAIKHTPSETHIWLRVEDTDAGALITVEDAGPGVPENLRLALFEPFAQGPQSATSPTPGTGIGLSLVLRFTQLHGGTVWIEERPGGGARFQVSIPRGYDPVEDALTHVDLRESVAE